MTLDIDLEWRDEDGNTALLVASACGSEEMVTTIISKNPNLDSLNKSGSNCVICATQNENRERVLELVITAGGDCRVVNRYGTGVERAIMELDVSGEEKERLMGIVGRVDDQIMNINF